MAVPTVISSEMTVSAADVVTNSLRTSILRGAIRAGERIHQDRVAEELGVSRQPVREALLRLHAEGLVTGVIGGGWSVRVFTQQHIRENYRLRVLLEAEAASDAARHITSGYVSELERLNAAIADAIGRKDPATILQLNHSFHRTIWTCSRLMEFVKILDSLWATITVATPLLVPERASKSVTEHQRILVELRSQEPTLAAQAMRAHILAAQAEFESSNAIERANNHSAHNANG